MSDFGSSCSSKNLHVCERCESSEDDSRRLMRRERNRASARKSRRRQTLRADLLHQACELLEQKNRKLRTEVDSLSEEQRRLNAALTVHEPLCPIMHCSIAPPSSPSLQPDPTQTPSV